MTDPGPISSAAPDEGHRQYRYSPPPGSTTILLVRHGESAPERSDRPFPVRDDHCFPLDQAATAYKAVLTGSSERVVLTP